MENETYKAVFKGEIAPGNTLYQVKLNLAQLFKTDLSKIENLFTGKPTILKENLSLEEAKRFKLVFEKSGAQCAFIKTPKPQEPSPNPTPQTYTPPPIPSQPELPCYEVRYQVLFTGEIIRGKEKTDVMANLSRFYKMNMPQVSQLFTGNPVTIKGPTDFWSASEYMKRFKECGAICQILLVEPTASVVAVPTEPSPTPEKESLTTESPETEEIKTLSNSIYENLTKSYRYIQTDFKIEIKLKAFNNSETTMGCLYLLIITGIIALLIWSPMRWYEGLILGIGLITFGTIFQKDWDLKYVDVFLSRMENLKKENPALFLFTLNRWVNDLTATDRAKPRFLLLVNTAINENSSLKPELDKYTEIFKPTPEEKNDIIETSTTKEEIIPEIKEEKHVLCPRCGSTNVYEDVRGFNWVKGIAVSSIFGPLSGFIFGSSKEGEAIYVCVNCNKKWKR